MRTNPVPHRSAERVELVDRIISCQSCGYDEGEEMTRRTTDRAPVEGALLTRRQHAASG